MHKPIYSSEEHKSIVDVYITMATEFVADVSTKTRYNNYLEVLSLIIEYSNGEGVKENNFYDWITILPINVAVATSGYFAGMETKRNAAVIRAYKVVLDQMLQETVSKLDKLEPTNE